MRSPHETHGITPITYTFHVSHTTTTTFISYIQFSFHLIIMYNSMPSLIPNIPISFIKPKHPSIFTYIIFRKNNPNNTCNKSSKQSIKQCMHSRTRSGEGLASLKQRALAQARHATVGISRTLAQARPYRLSETGRRSKRELVA